MYPFSECTPRGTCNPGWEPSGLSCSLHYISTPICSLFLYSYSYFAEISSSKRS